MSKVETDPRVETLLREHAELKEQFNAVIRHLKLVVSRPWVDRYGAIYSHAVVREQCKECGR